jgi:ribosomal protein L7Ae-like RNA K-turn-binding protein
VGQGIWAGPQKIELYFIFSFLGPVMEGAAVEMGQEEAFAQMCYEALKGGRLVKGLRQVTKSVLSDRAKLIIMSQAINEKKIVQVIEGLAQKHGVPIVKLESHEDIAAYARISKTDESGKVVKKLRCAVLTIEDFGSPSEGQRFILSKIGQ